MYDDLEHLNTLTGRTLSFTHYAFSWELSSYGAGSLFENNGPIGHIHGATIAECIAKAFAASVPAVFL